MRFEDLKLEHLNECSKIYIDTFNSEPWNDRWDEITSFKRLEDIYLSPGFVGLVAIENEKVIGAVLGNLEQWFEGNMYNLKEMFVKQDLKRSGIGSKMIEFLENELGSHDVTSITLFTSKGDLTESFYRRNGYACEDDMIMMSKSM